MIGELAVVLPAVVVGAAVQRLTGMGFALVVAPFLILVAGPENGVLTVNVIAAVNAAIQLGLTSRHFDWRRGALLVPSSLAGTVVGMMISLALDRAVAEVLIGVLLGGALLVSVLVIPSSTVGIRPALAVPAGTLSGAAASLAGLSGPPLAIYAALTGWRGESVAATFQGSFLISALSAAAAYLFVGAASLPDYGVLGWALVVLALVCGLLVGTVLRGRVPERWPWRLMFLIAGAGALVTTARGVIQLAAAASGQE